MKVFWSWQNDFAPRVCRHFIRDCLVEAIKAVADELGLEDADRPEIDHDTKNAAGMAEITSTILQKISRSAVFVADVTPVGTSESGKALPNPNVMIELGWAMSEITPERIISVLNEAGGWKPDDLPFDIRHRRALTYNLAEDADSKTRREVKNHLILALTGALRTNLGQYVESQIAVQAINAVSARSDDPSIWASAGDQLEHNDSMGSNHRESILLPHCARAYIRIIPASWKNGVPAVSIIGSLSDGEVPWPPLEGGGSGNFGVCEEGFVWYWHTGNDPEGWSETRNVTMFFDETGEIWALHGTALFEGRRGPTIQVDSVLRGWDKSLKKSLNVFKKLEASSVIKVEAGLSGVKGARWPGSWEAGSPPARKNRCIIECQERNWTEAAQTNFLTDAYNKIRDLFGLPHASRDDIEAILNK